MKMFKFWIILLFTQIVFSQDIYTTTDYPVRDFFLTKDTISYIQKRHVFIKPSDTLNSYFIGGYGLAIFYDSETNQIITVSNELPRTVCSVRFYHKSSKKVEEVYYYIKARALDAIILKEKNMLILSLENNKILMVDYSKKPEFVVKKEFKISSKSRRIIFNDNKLYYCSDLGEIFYFDFNSSESKRLVKHNGIITDFAVYDNYIIYSTLKGNISKYLIKGKKEVTLKLENNFSLNSLKFQKNKLICGTFDGTILVLNTETMSIDREIKYHDRTILKIYYHNNQFYSSSIDNTIRKWGLN